MSKFIKTQLELAKARLSKTEESITFEERKEFIEQGLRMSQERQDHDLKGQIFKSEDRVKNLEETLEDLSNCYILDFIEIAAKRKELKVAKANLELYRSLRKEFFGDDE